MATLQMSYVYNWLQWPLWHWTLGSLKFPWVSGKAPEVLHHIIPTGAVHHSCRSVVNSCLDVCGSWNSLSSVTEKQICNSNTAIQHIWGSRVGETVVNHPSLPFCGLVWDSCSSLEWGEENQIFSEGHFILTLIKGLMFFWPSQC